MTHSGSIRRASRCALLAAMLLGIAAAAGASTMPAHARHGSDKFDQMDINKDGRVILEEFRAAFPNMNEQAFAVIDTDKNGAIERAEWLEFTEGHAKGNIPNMPERGAPMNNIPGDPLIPPPDSADLPLMRPPAQ